MPLGDDDDLDEQLAADLLVEGSIGALNYALRGVESLPGRKTVVFVSEGTSMRNPRSNIPRALQQVIDRANRAGVVLYTLDPKGLATMTRSEGSDVAQRRTPNYTNEPLQAAPGQRRPADGTDRPRRPTAT